MVLVRCRTAKGVFEEHDLVLDAREAVEWIEMQCDALRAGVRVSNANISLQVTGGVACFPEHSEDAAELCRRTRMSRESLKSDRAPTCTSRLGIWRRMSCSCPYRWRAICWRSGVAEPAVHDLEDGDAGVEADEVGPPVGNAREE